MDVKAILAFFVLCLLEVYSYKPVVLLHGILSGADSMTFLAEQIEEDHPGTKVYNCDKFEGWYSLENAWRQVEQVREYIQQVGLLHPEGINVLGYSQGGVILRAAIQSLPNHNVHTFISLSSPQAGQYGTKFLHLIFPSLVAKTAFELFYSSVGQQTSIGGYWNDPYKQKLYLKYSEFLPFINNEKRSSNSTIFKSGIENLNRLVLIGGPNDGVITPWQSSHFAYFDESLNVIPFNKRDIYIKNFIGLKTLEEAGKLIIIIKSKIHHLGWHRNKHVIREVILPYLD